MVKLLFPTEGYVFDTHTSEQNEFIDRIGKSNTEEALEWLLPVKDNQEISKPMALTLKWEADEKGPFSVELSENADFSDGILYETTENTLEVSNLKIGTTYFWRVNQSEAATFKTENNLFRFIDVDGALNVRDVGGVAIKQGLVYRGSEIDAHFEITEKGKQTFCDALKIKTELDLRGAQEFDGGETSVAGASVKRVQLPYRPYYEVFEEPNRSQLVKIMELFANKENYPVYMHCMGGADRTQMISMFLRAIAGDTDEMMHLDYEMTSFSIYSAGVSEGVAARGFRSRNGSWYVNFLKRLEPFGEGKSISEKLLAFMADCGVTQSCMDAIRDIIKK